MDEIVRELSSKKWKIEQCERRIDYTKKLLIVKYQVFFVIFESKATFESTSSTSSPLLLPTYDT